MGASKHDNWKNSNFATGLLGLIGVLVGTIIAVMGQKFASDASLATAIKIAQEDRNLIKDQNEQMRKHIEKLAEEQVRLMEFLKQQDMRSLEHELEEKILQHYVTTPSNDMRIRLNHLFVNENNPDVHNVWLTLRFCKLDKSLNGGNLSQSCRTFIAYEEDQKFKSCYSELLDYPISLTALFSKPLDGQQICDLKVVKDHISRIERNE